MNKCFIVLGMHRTASSLLAKGLRKSGVNMGDKLLGISHGNPLGHYEDFDFLNMNRKILATAGGDWNRPPSEKAIIKAGRIFLSREIEKLISRKNKNKLWGWKDPRTILTIRCYMPFLDDPIFYVSLRKPEKVSASLQKRDKTSMEFGLELASIYHKRLMKFLAEQ